MLPRGCSFGSLLFCFANLSVTVCCYTQPIVSTVEGSFSSAGSGGGIFGTQCGVKLVNSQLRGNTAAANGGGAALQLCTAVFEQSVVENNEVRDLRITYCAGQQSAALLDAPSPPVHTPLL